MTQTNDNKTVDPATESPEQAKADAAPDEPTSNWKGAAEDLKVAGERGKKQWEQAIAKTREFLLGAKAGDGEPQEGAVDRMKKSIQEFSFANAQDRGAQLLLNVVTRVRKSLETFEASLEEARTKDETTAETPTEGTPAVA